MKKELSGTLSAVCVQKDICTITMRWCPVSEQWSMSICWVKYIYTMKFWRYVSIHIHTNRFFCINGCLTNSLLFNHTSLSNMVLLHANFGNQEVSLVMSLYGQKLSWPFIFTLMCFCKVLNNFLSPTATSL